MYNTLTKVTYFITLTVVDWVDVFTRPIYKHIVIDSLRYCQENKRLRIYAWVMMSNHLHLLFMSTTKCHTNRNDLSCQI